METGVAPPSLAYVKAASRVLLPDPEIFVRLREDGLSHPVIGDWLRSWLDLEGQADTIKWFESNVVPGILQCEAYIRALLTDEDAIMTRLQRQHILRSAKVTAIIDESALHKRIGSPEVMAEQLIFLLDCPATVYVLPTDASTHDGLDGPFVLATLSDREYVYLPTPARGFILEDGDVRLRMRQRWEAVATEALPRNLSQRLITEVAERWKQQMA